MFYISSKELTRGEIYFWTQKQPPEMFCKKSTLKISQYSPVICIWKAITSGICFQILW